jgi:cytosine/adenosine deaminase-related metal-dependent hydrolase
LARPKSARADDLRTPTEARWAQFSKFRSVDLLNLRPHHRARKLAANPAPFYTAWVNTINGAYASHEEALKGSITPGKLADFVVLADDPHTVAQDKIKDIAIVRTVTGGNTVYQA